MCSHTASESSNQHLRSSSTSRPPDSMYLPLVLDACMVKHCVAENNVIPRLIEHETPCGTQQFAYQRNGARSSVQPLAWLRSQAWARSRRESDCAKTHATSDASIPASRPCPGANKQCSCVTDAPLMPVYADYTTNSPQKLCVCWFLELRNSSNFSSAGRKHQLKARP